MLEWHEYKYYSFKENENKEHPLLFTITIPEKLSPDILYEIFNKVKDLDGGEKILNDYGITLKL